MIDQYKQLASDIVEYGKKLGADQVSTSLVNAVSFQVEVRDGKIESLKESGSAGMYVTLCQDQQRSTISSNDLRLETLRPLMRSAMQSLPFMGRILSIGSLIQNYRGVPKSPWNFQILIFRFISLSKK